MPFLVVHHIFESSCFGFLIGGKNLPVVLMYSLYSLPKWSSNILSSFLASQGNGSATRRANKISKKFEDISETARENRLKLVYMGCRIRL